MEQEVQETSEQFWTAMENADEAGMRQIADPKCLFVHIGVTADLDQEIKYYTDGVFKPTEIKFNSRRTNIFGDTAIELTDCDYALLLDGKETSHHFLVTEVYVKGEDGWKLIQFSFTPLIY